MSQEKSILMILDDESAVCRALKRTLRNRVDEIVSAENAHDAMTILESTPVTHVLCDHLLGPGQPRGMELVTDWKARFPNLKKIIILTGSAESRATPASGVDLVLPKTTDPADLAKHLGLTH